MALLLYDSLIGLCSAIACRSGLFHAGVSSHGVAHGADDVIQSGCPSDGIGPKGGLLFQRPAVDGYFPGADRVIHGVES